MMIDLMTCSLAQLRQHRPDLVYFLAGSKGTGPNAGVELFAGAFGVNPQRDWESSEALRNCWVARARGDEGKARAMFMAFAAQSMAAGEPYAERV